MQSNEFSDNETYVSDSVDYAKQIAEREDLSRMDESMQSSVNDSNTSSKSSSKLPTLPTAPSHANGPPGIANGNNLTADFIKSLSMAQKQFYNSIGFNMLATRAMMNVKNESSGTTQYEENGDEPRDFLVNKDMEVGGDRSTYNSHKFAPHRDGLSPSALAASIQDNEAVSMVFRRKKTYHAKPQKKITVSYSPLVTYGGENSNHLESNFSGKEGTSSSLHHFTTRYTLETPTDPSRLGIDLIVNHENNEPIIEVECGSNRGLLYINKLCQGSKGQSILFNKEWLTPNEFQFVSGRETAKDWKRSIRHCGKSLKTLMTNGILLVHPPVCECEQCRIMHETNQTPLVTSSETTITSIEDKPDMIPPSSNGQDKTASSVKNSGGLNSIISQLHSRASNGESDSQKSSGTELTASSPSMHRKRHIDTDTQSEEEQTQNKKSSKPQMNDKQDINSTGALKDTFKYLPQDDQYNRMLQQFNQSMNQERQGQVYTQFVNMPSMIGGDKDKHPHCNIDLVRGQLFNKNYDLQQRKRQFDTSKRSAKKKHRSSHFQHRLPTSETKPSSGFTPMWPILNGWNQQRPLWLPGFLSKEKFTSMKESKSSVQQSSKTEHDVNNNIDSHTQTKQQTKDATPMVVLHNPHSVSPNQSSPMNLSNRLRSNEDQRRRNSSSAPPPPLGQENFRQFERPRSAKTLSPIPTKTQESISAMKTDFNQNPDPDSKLLDGIDELSLWSIDDVCHYIESIGPGFKNYVETFRSHSIDGRALVLLTERHMVDEMGLRLGHALNILSRVRERLGMLRDILNCCHSRDANTLLTSSHRKGLPVNGSTYK